MRPGKKERLQRLFNPADGRAVCVAADHGWMSDMTFNVVKLKSIVEKVVAGGADAILMSLGQATRLGHLLRGRQAPALIIRADWMNLPRMGGANEIMNAVPVQKLRRVAAATATDALHLGASAITIYYFIGYDDSFEARNIESLAIFARECSRIGLPCIIEPMAVGGMVTGLNIATLLINSARIAAEIGADALKIPYTNDIETMKDLCKAAGVPVLMLGGARSFLERDALEIVAEGLEAGVSGVVFGRNVTKARDPEAMVRQICGLVHGGKTVDELVLSDLGPRIRLRVDAGRCSGCRICEIACHQHHRQAMGVRQATIRVTSRPVAAADRNRPLHRPVVCTLCGRCVEACSAGAIQFSSQTGALVFTKEKCTGCGACVEACPLDLVVWNREEDRPTFCDLCGGTPMCAKYCERQAITVVAQTAKGDVVAG